MATKEIDVTCPCCSTRLTVDVLTGQVLKRRTPEKEGSAEPKRDVWESAQDRVRGRTDESSKKLESALDYERTKEARFDELFRKASDKNQRKDEE